MKNDIALKRKYLKQDLKDVLFRFSLIIISEESEQVPEGTEYPVSTG